MKKFKYLLFAIIFLIMGCGTTNQINSQEWAEIGLDGYMIKTFDKIITPIQLDSLCIADTLSRSLDEWVRMSFYDTEAKTQVIQYLYIKTTTTETLYTAQEMTDSTYYVVCRTIKEDNIE